MIALFTFGTRGVVFVPDLPENQVCLPAALEPLRDTLYAAAVGRVDGSGGLQGNGTLFRIPDVYRLFERDDPRPWAHLVYDMFDAKGSLQFAREIMSDPRVDLREQAVILDPLPVELPGARPLTA